MFKVKLIKKKDCIQLDILDRPKYIFKAAFYCLDLNKKVIFKKEVNWDNAYNANDHLTFVFYNFHYKSILARGGNKFFLNLSMPIGKYFIYEDENLKLDEYYDLLVILFSLLNKNGIEKFKSAM